MTSQSSNIHNKPINTPLSNSQLLSPIAILLLSTLLLILCNPFLKTPHPLWSLALNYITQLTLVKAYDFRNASIIAVESPVQGVAERFYVAGGVDDGPGVDAGRAFAGFGYHEKGIEAGKEAGEVEGSRIGGVYRGVEVVDLAGIGLFC